MSWVFGDSFDCYAAPADAVAGYWDSGAQTGMSLVAGRFTSSQCMRLTVINTNMTKSSAVNDPVHHIVCAFRQTATLSGSTLGMYFQLVDNVTNQVCIVFRSDGVILLTSATPAGTVLATYSGAVTAANTWFAFEFEVVINNTTGAFRARKNGNTSNDFDSGATLNTRPGANNYANKLLLGCAAGISAHDIDDILWRSDAASVPWVGDIRCYTRMPASDVSVQFSRAPNPVLIVIASSTTGSDPTATAHYTAFTASVTGTIGTVMIGFNPGFTGNCKMAMFADNAGAPGAVLGSATTVVNPVTGNNTFTFGTPVAVSKGVQYWFGVSHDVTAVLVVGAANSSGRTGSGVAYASFPTANPVVGTNVAVIAATITITSTSSSDFVNETLQDGATSYVYDSNVGDADFYNIAALSGTPSSTVCVTTRGFVQKSDAGTRNAAVQLKSGATTVQSPSTALSTSFGWLWRTDTVDPSTGAAWTATGVNNCTIGPIVTV